MSLSRLALALATPVLSSTLSFAAPTPVTLEAAFLAAAQRSEVLKKSDEDINQVDALHSRGIGGVLPSIAMNGRLVRQDPGPAEFQAFSPATQKELGITATQPLFKGFREWFGLNAVAHRKTSQQAARNQAEIKLFQEVASNYLNILTLQKDLQNLSEQSDLYEERVRDLQGRAQRGESNRSDVVSAEATQAALFAETRLVEGDLEGAQETFHFLTGLPRDAQMIDPNIAARVDLPPLESFLSRVERRPDVRGAKETFEGSQSEVTAAWGLHSPTLEAKGSYYFVRPGFMNNIRWDVGLYLTVPIFEGGGTQAQVTDAISKRKQAELELTRTRRSAQQEIRTLFQKVRARFEHLSKLKTASELAEKNSILVRRDYERGLVRNLDVQLALTEFRNAQRNYDKSRFATQLDLYQLRAAAMMVPALSERSN